MSRVPMLIQNSNSRLRVSLVSEISFEEDDFLSGEISFSSTGSSNRDTKWCAGTEPCHFVLESNRICILAEGVSSSKPIPMPERRCSTNGLLVLPMEETKNQALTHTILNPRGSKQEEDIPSDKLWSSKESPGQPPLVRGSKGRMANTKWDDLVGGARGNTKPDFSDNETSPALSTVVSTTTSSSGSSSDGRHSWPRTKVFNKMRTSFSSRSYMDGSIHGSMDLRKPTRKISKGRDLNESHKTSGMIPAPMPAFTSPGYSSFVDPKKQSIAPRWPRHVSTMPLTMPVRQVSTQDLLKLTTPGSTNALRSKLSRSKLQNVAYNPMVPRREGSALSMVQNQSRNRLQKYG